MGEKQTPVNVRNIERGSSWVRQAQASRDFGLSIRAHTPYVAEREEKLMRGLTACRKTSHELFGMSGADECSHRELSGGSL